MLRIHLYLLTLLYEKLFNKPLSDKQLLLFEVSRIALVVGCSIVGALFGLSPLILYILVLPDWIAIMSGIARLIGKYLKKYNIGTFKAGQLIECRNFVKYQNPSNFNKEQDKFFVTAYPVDVRNNTKLGDKELVESALEAVSEFEIYELLLDLVQTKQLKVGDVAFVVEDEQVNKNPIQATWNPYKETCPSKVKVLLDNEKIYWVNPAFFKKVKQKRK